MEGIDDDSVQLSFAAGMAVNRAFNHVFQFTNIPGPGVAEQRLARVVTKPGEKRRGPIHDTFESQTDPQEA